MAVTTDPDHPDLGWGAGDNKPVEQNQTYLVLSVEERKKGFVRPVRRKYIHNTCKTETVMGLSIAETYARDPGFYGSTYCMFCKMHRPVSEFVWSDTDLLVGS